MLWEINLAVASMYTADYSLLKLMERLEIQPQAVVGHSSGAACVLRLLERAGNDESAIPKLRGAILVAAAYTDLGDAHEARSEYFSRDWDWDKIKAGAHDIVCFHGENDPLIPVAEARYIASKLEGDNDDDRDNFEYQELPRASHFWSPWPESLQVMDSRFGSGGGTDAEEEA